jgi:FixJ family two-component response regulator
VFVTGCGDAHGVRAMKARRPLEKPVDESVLLATIQAAMERHASCVPSATTSRPLGGGSIF